MSPTAGAQPQDRQREPFGRDRASEEARGHRAADPSQGGETPAEELLREGAVTVHGRIAGSSNATLLVTCAAGETGQPELLAVYKPVRGERPLWDFPPGLHRREVAAYELDRLLGWQLVPETVLRGDGPYGPGSMQRVVAADDEHYFSVRDDEGWHPLLRRIAAFDVLINNADRKAGHVLHAEGTLYGIDHGLTFHEEDKLRTVIWDFVGDPLGGEVTAGLKRITSGDELPDALQGLLDGAEVDALIARAEMLLAEGCLPEPGPGRPYPWPLV